MENKFNNEIDGENMKDENNFQNCKLKKIDDENYREDSINQINNKNNEKYKIPLFDCILSDIKEICPSFSSSFFTSNTGGESKLYQTSSLHSTDSEVVLIGTVVNITILVALSCSPSVLPLPLTPPLS